MKSIRRRLEVHMLGVIFLLIVLGFSGFCLFARNELLEQFDIGLRVNAEAIIARTEFEDGALVIEHPEPMFKKGDDPKQVDFHELRDAAGRTVLSRSPDLPPEGLPIPPGIPAESAWDMSLPGHRPGRAMALHYRPGNSPVARELTLVVASDAGELVQEMQRLVVMAAVSTLTTILVALWLLPRVLRRALAPLDELNARVTAIDAGTLGTRLVLENLPAELRPLHGNINALLARLDASFDRERRFGADVAHELRTPLAELRAVAECALTWPETRAVETDRDVLAITWRMESLVGALTALARADGGALRPEFREVRLDELVRATWAPFIERAAARRIRVLLTAAPHGASTDPALLGAVLANLFDNALSHAPAGDTLEITLRTTPTGREIRVANAAPELAEADLDKLFDRFWRHESSRTDGANHLGLGLPIARAFAAAAGWSLHASAEPDRRIALVLEA